MITATAYTLASLGKNSVIPPRILPFLAVLLLVLMSAHIGVRWLAHGADSTLLPVAVLLNGLGYVMIARLSERLAGLQTTWTFIGVVCFIAVLFLVQRVNDLARYKWTFFFFGAGLLLLPMVPGIGFSSGGARIWVSVGPINLVRPAHGKLVDSIFQSRVTCYHCSLRGDSPSSSWLDRRISDQVCCSSPYSSSWSGLLQKRRVSSSSVWDFS